MTQTTKIILGVVGVLIIGWGAYYFWNQSERGPGELKEAESQNAAAFDHSTALPSGSDTSDASLDQDMSAINAQVQAADADVANVDASVN